MSDPHEKAPFTQASDFPPEVLRLFDRYVHGALDRRGFLDGAARYAIGGMTAAGLLAALSPKFAQAQKVAPTDPRIEVASVDIASPKGYGHIRALIARPANASGAKPGVVLVAHENRGLNPHIEDIARRLAVDGFIAVAPDALTTLGGYPGDEDKARTLFGQLDQGKTREDFIAAAHHAQTLPGGNGKLGTVGFCWGGSTVNMLVEDVPTIVAGVPFYGTAPPLAKVPQIRAELLMNYAGDDDRVNSTFPPYDAALKAAGVKHESFTYAGTQHGFNNDTTPRFDQAAARLAWSRTIDLFRRTLA